MKIIEKKVDEVVQQLNQVAHFPNSAQPTLLWPEEIPTDSVEEGLEYLKIFQDEEVLKNILYIIGYNGGHSIIRLIYSIYGSIPK